MITVKENYDLLQLESIEAKPPMSDTLYGKRAGSVWQPVPHAKIMEEIYFQAERRKWKTQNLKCAFNQNKSDMAATVELILPDLEPPQDMTFCIGVMNSNYQHFRSQLFGGVVYKGIGMTFYETKTKKHSKRSFHLPIQTNICISKIHKSFPRYVTLVKELDEHVVLEPEKLLYRCSTIKLSHWNREVIAWKRIKRIERLYRKLYPSSWSLLTSFCRVVRDCPPLTQMKQHLEFLYLLLEESVRVTEWQVKKNKYDYNRVVKTVQHTS